MRTAFGLLALAVALLVAPGSAGAVTLEGARTKALNATQSERKAGTILFGLTAPIRRGSSIRESGRRPPPSGASTRPMRRVLTVRGERAYFFYLDRGAYQNYEHPGRVVLVGATSGRVTRSRTLKFAPTVNGRLPVFLRSREGYELTAYRVSVKPYVVAGAARAVRAGLGAFGGEPSLSLRSAASEGVAAAQLAAERSCTVAIGARRSGEIGSIGSASGSAVLPLMVYDASRGRSLATFVASEAIGRRGCRDILFAITGDGYRSFSPPTLRTSLATSGASMREHHVTTTILRSVITANPSVTFKLMVDGPGSGAYIEALRSLANVLVIATSSTSSQTAYRFLPEKMVGGDLRRNPLRRRADSSFFTTQLFGAAAFVASDAEVAHAAAEVAAGRAPSFLAYLIARAFELSRPFDFTSDLGATQRLYKTFSATPPGPTNRAPVALAQSVSTVEDTAKPIVLGASDPDGDALTFMVGAPAHGTLSGTAPNLTYTPAADFAGTDSFTFSVSDGSLISATVTVSIAVTAVDDPPVTSASGTLAYTEDDPPTPIAPALTVTDVDSSSLTGATVQITGNHAPADDLLALTSPPAGITVVFDAPTGTLTLSGSASVAAYEAALRAVTYENSSDNPGNASRTVTFKARDAGGFGPAALRTISIAPVNDAPAITTSGGPLSYTEADPPKEIDPALALTDPDSQIAGATVQITGNLASAEDVLALTSPPAGITVAPYVAASGTLTLSGIGSVAAYQAALRAVTYANTSSNPSTLQRTVSFQATDTAAAASNVATRDVAITATNNAPDVDNSPGALAYTENDPATAIDPTIAVTDVDSTNLTGALVTITGNHASPEDVLALPAQPIITASYDSGTGTLTLSGTDTIAAYETALEAVTYANTSDNPSTATRTVTYQARDAGGFGGADTHAITIAAVDDPPVAVNDSATVGEDSGATAVGVLTNDTDVDAGPKAVVSVTQPANGSVVNNGTDVTYTPNANYCNSPAGTPDTFTYTLNGGSTATVSMTVTCDDDPPVAVNDSATVAEDSGANAITVLANDADNDGGPISVASVTQPANGSVVNNGTDVTYTPNANYCNSPVGTPDTFTYTLTPGTSTATVSVTVTCSDDPPVAVNDAAIVAEDSGPAPVDVLANDTDVDVGPKLVQSVTQPANGSAVITGGGTGVSYTPNADYCNSPPGTTPDTFTYSLNGGSTATVSITVICSADAPVVNTSAGTPTYTENDPPMPIDPAVTVTDVDVGGTITGATVQISSNYAGAQDVLALGGVHPLIAAMQVGDTLTLSGTASPAAYQAALRDVTYSNTSDSPSTLLRTATFTVTDDTALTGSDTRDFAVGAVDDDPVAVNDSTTVGEDSGVTLIFVLTNDTDVDGGPIAVSSVTQPANGTVSNNGTDVSYTPNANYCNNPPGTSPDTFTYTLTPGGSTATVSVTVTCAADPPDVTTSGGALAYTENDPATPIDPGLTVTDPDAGAMITGATVAITANFAGAQDVLALAGVHPGISAGPQVGNTLSLTGTATPAAYQAALRDVTYVNTSEGPSTLTRTVTFTVTDETALSDSATRGITVAAVNDPPTAVDDSGTTDEDTPLSVAAPGVLANDTDVDPGDTKTVVALNGTGTLTQTLPSGASVTIAANGSYTYNPLAAFQGLSTGQTASDSFTYTMQDGAGAQDAATVNITINGISDAPTAVADSFDAIGNTGLFVGTTRPATQAGKEITGSVLANDTDPDTPQASLVAEPVTNAPTTLGGTITIESDGNFTYHPDDADVGVTDTFTYRVCDNSPCNSGTIANATGTLSLPLTGQVWYVRNNEPAGGDGTSDTPFDTLAEAEAASGTGDTVFVFDGSNTTTNLDTGYAMNANERLIGESRPLSLDPDGGGPLGTSPLHPGTSGAQPTLTASNEDVVVLASNTLVDGVDVDPSGTGGGISGGAGTDAVTVQNVNVTDTGTAGTQPGIEMDGTTGVNRFTGVTVTNGGSATAIGVRINNADRVLFANTATNTIATTGAKALDAASTSLLTSRWNDITVTGSGTGAIRLSSTTGQPVLGDGSATDLSLQTTSGATAALDIASSNTVTVDSAGTDTISATGGPAADIRNSNGSQYFFDSASSTNSAGDGVNLDTNLTAPVVINAGTIAGAAGIAFDVNGGGVGGGGVVYDGAINDGPGQSVEVTGRDGGGVTFSGNIADSADAGGGIVVASNSQGSTSFSGASKVLNTGAGNAVVGAANGNPAGGHLMSFTNGGLDIDTTSGSGFSATNGTLTVGGTGNSITTGTGTGLNVDTAGITVGNLNFDSISSNGAASGIRLFTTGTTGRLIVTGTGGTCTFATPTCTGGNIANSTGDGISLISTASPTFTRVNVHDGAGNGMRASDVSALSVDNSILVDNSDDIATNDEANLRMHNVTGTSSVTNSLFREARVHEVYWTPTTATGAMTWTNNTVGPDNAGELGGGLVLNPTGTATTTLNVSGGAFTGNNGDSLRPAGSDTTATTVNVTGGTTFLDSNSGVNFSADDDADMTFDVTGSTFTRHASHALQMIVNDNTTASSIIRGEALNNVIGNGTADSGSRDANGISYDLEGAADIVLNVANNTVRNTDTQGIFIQSVRFPSGTPNVGPNVDLHVRDNTVTNIDDNSAFPFGFQHGTQIEARRNSTMCLDIAGNTSTGIGGAEHFRVRQRDASTFRLERQGAVSGTNDAALATFIAGQNDAGSTASVTHATTFTAVADGFCDDVP